MKFVNTQRVKILNDTVDRFINAIMKTSNLEALGRKCYDLKMLILSLNNTFPYRFEINAAGNKC